MKLKPSLPDMEEAPNAESSHLNSNNSRTAEQSDAALEPATLATAGTGDTGSGHAQVIRTATGAADQTDAGGGSESRTGGIIQ
jgi:hypothetical protein